MASVTHVSRQPESIILNDRDVLAFVHDRMRAKPGDGAAIAVKAKKEDTANIYEVAAADIPEIDERCLTYGRSTTDGSIANGMRCCIYTDPTESKPVQAKVLREVISPRVTYDRASGVIMMWFWTNFEEGFSGTNYDETKVVLIDEDTFSLGTSVVRALCCCSGSAKHVYVTGGAVKTILTAKVAANGYDIVPVFSKPKILQLLPVPDATGGIAIVDFGGTGGGGATVVQATADGNAGGTVSVKQIVLKSDPSLEPNFEQTGEAMTLTYFKM